MTQRIAILGGGISGLTAAWQLAQHDRTFGGLDVVLFEASNRLGGILETVHRDGFTVECGPDGWVSEKPWARELARELGLHHNLVGSLDAGRATCLLIDGKLVEMPAGMRLMVPTNLAALAQSPLFSEAAIRAYREEPARAEELKRSAPDHDESIADFVRRHFGEEVLTKVAAPLLAGVFGGDVCRLSVRAVMPGMVAKEREFGSLVLGFQQAPPVLATPEPELRAFAPLKPSIFTSIKAGTAALIHRMAAELPAHWLRLNTPVTSLERSGAGWLVDGQRFDDVIVALPAHVARELLAPLGPRFGELLTLEASSAVLVALAFTEHFPLPRGFGFLVRAGEPSQLLAGTFVDQKYPDRVPPGCRLLRAFFGDPQAGALAAASDAEVTALALTELAKILGPLPEPAFSVVRHWPRSLPQYGVGHGERVRELEALVAAYPGLRLVGNALRGVGIPDLVRAAREAARSVIRPDGVATQAADSLRD